MTFSPSDNKNSRTTPRQAFIHLLKGYVGPGCLSLPWAVSQLGIRLGVIVVFVTAYWTSHNIWQLVTLKRQYCEERRRQMRIDTQHNSNNNNSNHRIDTNITYADLSGWLYGKRLQKWTTISICVQQLAVCTVFLSFIGENLGAALECSSFIHVQHTTVITMALPAAVMLSCLPNLKMLAPVMGLATVTLFAGFGVLGYLIQQAWGQDNSDASAAAFDAFDAATSVVTDAEYYSVTKLLQDAIGNSTTPDDDSYNNASPPPPQLNLSMLPLAICAVLYSFEGICLILPIEASMQEEEDRCYVPNNDNNRNDTSDAPETTATTSDKPRRKYFGIVFVLAMTISAIIFALIASLCVMAFGSVNSGSITAFLVEQATSNSNNDGDDEEARQHRLELLYLANTLVSVAVLLTFPLQMFPNYELVGPWWNKVIIQRLPLSLSTRFEQQRRQQRHMPVPDHDGSEHGSNSSSGTEGNTDDEFQQYERNISLPPLRNVCTETAPDITNNDTTTLIAYERSDSNSSTSLSDSALPTTSYMATPNTPDQDDTNDNEPNSIWQFEAVGDSPFLRIALVLLTYILAIAVPNVQLLVSLAGALSGSATGLIIPPMLQWAYWKKHQQKGLLQQQQRPPNNDDGFHDEHVEEEVVPSRTSSFYWRKRIELAILVSLGYVVMIIGTSAAVADIFRVYMGSDE